MMTEEQLFNKMAILLQRLKTFQKTGTLAFTDIDEKLLVKEVYQHLIPGVAVDLGCPKCVLQYLNMMQSYWDRDYPIFITKQPIVITESIKEIEKEVPVVIKSKEQVKLKRKYNRKKVKI